MEPASEQKPNESEIKKIVEIEEKRKREAGIRTMAEDITMLTGKKRKEVPRKKGIRVTPDFLRQVLIKRREKMEERIREKEEKIEKLAKLKEEKEKKKEEVKIKKEEEIKRAIEERIKKREKEKEARERERQRILMEMEAKKRLEERRKKEKEEREKRKKIEKKFKIPPSPEALLAEGPKVKVSILPGIFIFFLLLGGFSGLFLIFKNYQLTPPLPPQPPLPKVEIAVLPTPPGLPTHKECKGTKCVTVEGEGPDLCKTDKDCRPVLPPLFIDISESLPLTKLTSDVFISLIDKKFQKEYKPGTFIEIIPKYKGELLTISQLFEALDLHPPKEVKNNLETYTLYLYSQKELFVQKRRNRLGIAFRIKEGKAGIVRVAMAEWEKVLPDDFNKVHTLWKRGAKASPYFLDNYYSGVHIRYANFPVPDLSIDWAITDDILLLTTSRESMWRTIDKIK